MGGLDQLDKIGLIAGNGKFPLLFAKAARAKGLPVVAAAVRGDTSWLIHLLATEVRWFAPGELKSLFAYFRSQGVKKVLMAGQVHPRNLFRQDVAMDEEFQELFKAMADRRCDTIFGAVADRLAKEGLELLDSTFLLQDHLAPRGTLTRHAPTEAQLQDIRFGIGIAKQMGGLDVGQTVVVKDMAVVAIEALEGTDQCILRGGAIARQDAVVVKTSKPKQDSRFDVPVIGPRTILTMRRCRSACLAIEAGKTLIIDRDRTVALADKAGIAIVAA
ncbi:MAG: LpxI family protein [Candidatus Omnitrophica bacterium]|nr:LpxI family protein [Candidatus Omnitrophota bacterium]